MTRYNHSFILSISFVSALGGYLFGFDFAVISGALPFLKTTFGLDTYWEGFATGSLALGAILGSVLAGGISGRYGRRKGLLLAAMLFGVSSLAMALAPTRYFFIGARFFAGAGVGMASLLSPMYIAEISPASFRGRMVAINQLTVVIGILVTNLINYTLRNTGPDAWRWMFGLGVVPSALFVLGALWLPESPRWLAEAGRTAEAERLLERIGGKEYAHKTLGGFHRSAAPTDKRSAAQGLHYGALLHRAVFPSVLVGIGLAVFQQFCGINVVFNYTPAIFASIGVARDGQLLQTVFIGGVNLVFTVAAMLLVDKVGRKPLMLAGAVCLSLLYLAVVHLLGTGAAQVSWFLLASIGTYALTLAPVTWVLIAEVFPGKIRSAATSLAVLCLWAAYFVLVFTFPPLFERLGDKTFYLYAGICALGAVFVALKVKETKGKTLEELEDALVIH
ncbi:sugar porter family MFS transporter [Dinghuibacter silviterrae]|uniref:Sugar porter (SP) family MFS transporter n=1 Tax=Dinghuibacter silviterrae TaxID=1539049 RepID=A0A4R8DGS7_9BACT|nr:sugar porter family MFS transporter [Dinghuibacter silviterrae]TDW96873.1 sugar porter (SP) family MFS transporter [Dinghuibacter silviterrae]